MMCEESVHTSFNVKEYGAVGDGQTLDTIALQSAIDTCHDHGGGAVMVPAGQYVKPDAVWSD